MSLAAQATGSHEVSCRLCEGPALERFKLWVLNKYLVRYYECGQCGSLQTQQPTWLQEAYVSSLSHLDTGAAQRNIVNRTVVYCVARLFGFRDIIDFGGGDGLLCRLLRDLGFNCHVVDRYAKPTYAQSFVADESFRPELVTAFEILEHLPNPQKDLLAIFAATPNAVLFSTVPYAGQGRGWWYLAPSAGQHVFLFSSTAMQLIADAYGYQLTRFGEYFLFLRPGFASRYKLRLLRLMLTTVVLTALHALVAVLPKPGIQSDFDQLGASSSPSGSQDPTPE